MRTFSGLVGRVFSGCAIAGVVSLSLATTSCGGGSGGGAAKSMVLVGFEFVDRALRPSFPTGVTDLPRNAQIVFNFSELVNPQSVDDQTIQIRWGPQFQSVPKGSFQVDGDRVIFDPTITAQGVPNPFGFEPVMQYIVDLPAVGNQNAVVRNLDNDPLLTPYLTGFTTSDGYLRELVPPSVIGLTWTPTPNPVTKQTPALGYFTLEFSEAMDPASFIQAYGPSVLTTDTFDVRYSNLSPDPNVNNPTLAPTGGVENTAVPGTLQLDPAAKKWTFIPTFSFGDKKYIFTIAVYQGLTDLSGNQLVNPRSWGPFTCDGTGTPPGRLLAESFDNQTNNDTTANPGNQADWGQTTPGTMQGAPITSRRVYVAGYRFAESEQGGQYNVVAEPLTGANLGPLLQSIGQAPPNPPTNQGRRVMWSYSDGEMGQNGTVTTASWGPDSNATFAAQYPDVILRIGFQKTASMSLAATFSGNYLGNPLVFYKGTYSVSQSANVGNQEPVIKPTHAYTMIAGVTNPNTPACDLSGNPQYGCYTPAAPAPGCTAGPPPNPYPWNWNMMDCLYVYTGYVDWPDPQANFDWDEGDPNTTNDVVMVWDNSCQEGDIFQSFRLWFGVTAPNSGVPISGFPLRRMYATYEEDTPNPQSNFAAGIQNPEFSVTDNAFTFTKRVSVGQIRFFTPGPGDPALNPTTQISATNTFGVKSDYMDAIVTPAVQAGGATELVEYQGATALDPTGNRSKINAAFPFTAWTSSVNDCDTYPYLRWRCTLTSNLKSLKVAKVSSIVVPIVQLP